MDLRARTLEALDWPFVVEALAGHARTPAGRAAAAGVEFASDSAVIAEAFDTTGELLALSERAEGPVPVGGIEEIGDALSRAERGDVLDLGELRSAGFTLTSLAALRAFVGNHAAAAPTIARLAEPIRLDAGLLRRFEAAFDDAGQLSERSYPALGELRRRIASLERSMRTLLEGLLESPEYADLLQDRYITVRGDRFVLPVKAEAKGLGLGIVHDASRTERTVFVEPAVVVPVGNQRRMAEAALRDEERRILGELSSLLGSHAAPLRDALAAAARLDLACARADFAQRLGAIRPEVGPGGVISLRQARHPVLVLSGAGVVANDLCLDAARPVLVLTGPNAGGKTVAMKTIGLCALLVRAGCFVPAAAGSRVDVFGRILADIGDLQTVHDGLSSFSAHLKTLREMLAVADHSSLLLLDEIAAGTDPAQGGPLARAVIERLADVGARVVATTHYTPVKAMAADDQRVAVAALEYRDARPTYRVVAGSVGESHALAAAERIGIDAALLARARALMSAGERALHDALSSLEADRARASDAQLRAEKLLASLAERERAVAFREQESHGRAREVERRAASATVAKLRAAEEEVRAALDALHKERSRERVHAARSAIAGARQAASDAARREPAITRDPRAGDRVRVVGLGLVGDVVAVHGDTLELRAGSMTVRAKPSEVEIIRAGGSARSSPAPARKGAAADASPEDWLDRAMRSDSNTLDLRGVRVEEGIERLHDFLDEAMLASRDVVFVLHGHGSGAMKSAVRRALSESPYVSASSPAPDDQGGDALTVSRLRD